MGLRIQTNIEAMDAHRNLLATSGKISQSMSRLSSGFRINKASDDAAGLAISEKLQTQVGGLGQAQRNAQDGISMIQTAEGALNETHSILQRMRELGVQAANGTLTSSDQTAISSEMSALRDEIDRIAGKTQFNNMTLLQGTLQGAVSGGTLASAGATMTQSSVAVDSVAVSNAAAGTYNISVSTVAGTITLTNASTNVAQNLTLSAMTSGGAQTLNFSQLGVQLTLTGANVNGSIAALNTDLNGKTLMVGGGSAQLQIGANAGDTLGMAIGDARSTTVGSVSGNSLSNWVNNFASAIGAGTYSATVSSLLSAIDQAITDVSKIRGNLGATQNRLEHTIANLGVAQENLTASESRIRDVDMAAEMVNFTKTGILQQAGQAILAQANSSPSGIVQLLRG
jgi:flagellin